MTRVNRWWCIMGRMLEFEAFEASKDGLAEQGIHLTKLKAVMLWCTVRNCFQLMLVRRIL